MSAMQCHFHRHWEQSQSKLQSLRAYFNHPCHEGYWCNHWNLHQIVRKTELRKEYELVEAEVNDKNQYTCKLDVPLDRYHISSHCSPSDGDHLWDYWPTSQHLSVRRPRPCKWDHGEWPLRLNNVLLLCCAFFFTLLFQVETSKFVKYPSFSLQWRFLIFVA